MRIFQSHPAPRWAVPAVVVGVIGGTSLIAVSASAQGALPDRSAQQLLIDLQQSHVDTFSGTVVQKSDLGLPQLPGVGGGSDTSLTSLISGTHTLQIWSSGENKQRLAIHGALGETDIIRNGTDVWNWSSQGNKATHTALSADEAKAKAEPAAPSDAPKTPQEAATKLLAAVEPTTSVTTNPAVTVAGRDAYALVLEPKKNSGSLIGQVRIAIDGEKKIPLGVTVIAADGTTVFDTSFSSIDFSAPDEANFTFNAPRGTKVTEQQAPSVDKDKVAQHKAQADKNAKAAQLDTKTVGSGWSTVVVRKADLSKASSGAGGSSSADRERGQASMQQILNALPKVSGSWGSGRLLASKAFSVVITDDGRIAAGAVAPEKLYKALR